MNYSNKQLYRSFSLSFGLLIALAFVGFLFVDNLTREQAKNSEFINLSGKQRMYTVRVMLYAQSCCQNNNAKAQDKLRTYITKMRKDHSYLQQHLISEELHSIYFKHNGLNTQIATFFTQAELLLKQPSEPHLKNLLALSETLITQLNIAVNAFESKNLALTETLKQRQLLIFLAIVLLILLEAHFIVRPLIKFIGNYTNELEETVQRRTKKYLLYANIFKNTAEGVMITDADRIIVDVNESFSAITGYCKERIVGKTPAVLKSGKHTKAFYEAMWDDIDNKGRWNGTLINRHYNGHNYHETLSIIKLYDDDNNISNYIGVFSDISTLIQNEEEMRHLATHDTLTGLPNRYFLLDRINHAIDVSERNESLVALVFLDLDNFKVINDSMGHQVGDEFLIEIAKRLTKSVRKSDTVARLGGDEFVILLETIPAKEELSQLLEKILNTLRESFVFERYKFTPSASFGVAFSSYERGCHAENLLRRADLAMYQAKELGKNQIIYYSSVLEQKAQHYLQVETRLHDALSNRELNLYFQPKVDLKTQTVLGAEILIRWEHEENLLSPEQFIPIAEESSLIIEVDQWVCQETLHIIKSWQSSPMQKLLFSINISARTFSNAQAMEQIMTQIVESGYAKQLDLEITETVLIHNYANALYTLEQLHNHGISTSLDDFGTGYSSFSYLSKLPFNTIKIDRSFTMDLQNNNHQDERQKVLVDAMISFSKRLGMRVIAEGIETEEQLQWLLEHNCDEGQGYYFSRPIDQTSFEHYMLKR